MDDAENKNGSQEATDTNIIEMTGIIIPIEWDNSANPTKFALSAYDEQEYLIDNFTALCIAPQSLLRKKIKVLGILKMGDKKRKKIIVSRFDLLENDLNDLMELERSSYES